MKSSYGVYLEVYLQCRSGRIANLDSMKISSVTDKAAAAIAVNDAANTSGPRTAAQVETATKHMVGVD